MIDINDYYISMMAINNYDKLIHFYIYVFNLIAHVYVHKFVNISYIKCIYIIYIYYIYIYIYYFSHEFSYSVFLCDLSVYFITVNKF